MHPALLALQQSTGSIISPTPPPTPSPEPSPTPSAAPSATESIIPGWDALQSVAAQNLNPNTVPNCQPDDFSVCGLVVRMTGNLQLGQVLDLVLGTPMRVILIILIGVLIRRGLHQVIDRLSERIATGPAAVGPPPATPTPATPTPAASTTSDTTTTPAASTTSGTTTTPAAPSPLLTTRRQARARTLAQVLRSITTIGAIAVVVLMTLQELGFSVAPLLSIAGVFGVALGFGAQSLVRDVVSGMFMIVEDQYGVGDVVDVGAASGTVEAVGLRITRLRDVNGTVWYVRNGEILRVGNESQGWSRVVLDINVGYEEDIDRAEHLLLESALELRTDERFQSSVIDEPEVWGVEALTTEGAVIRLVVKTVPTEQWAVARELRRRIKQRFDAEDLEMRTVPRTVIMNDEEDLPQTRRSDTLE